MQVQATKRCWAATKTVIIGCCGPNGTVRPNPPYQLHRITTAEYAVHFHAALCLYEALEKRTTLSRCFSSSVLIRGSPRIGPMGKQLSKRPDLQAPDADQRSCSHAQISSRRRWHGICKRSDSDDDQTMSSRGSRSWSYPESKSMVSVKLKDKVTKRPAITAVPVELATNGIS